MTIDIGDNIPSVNLATMGAKGKEDLPTDDLFRDKKVVIFGVPGAFTPTCSAKHLPGFVEYADAIKAKGVAVPRNTGAAVCGPKDMFTATKKSISSDQQNNKSP